MHTSARHVKLIIVTCLLRYINNNNTRQCKIMQRPVFPVFWDILHNYKTTWVFHSLLMIQCQFVWLPRLESDLKAMLIRDTILFFSPSVSLSLVSNLRFTLAELVLIALYSALYITDEHRISLLAVTDFFLTVCISICYI